MKVAKYHRGSTYVRDMRAAYGGTPSTKLIRKVWALLTKYPTMSGRRMARRLGAPVSETLAAVRVLRVAGYVEEQPGTAGARVVVVPFYLDTRIRTARREKVEADRAA